jgi:hypothetical protein
VLHALTREAADAICVQRALSGEDKCRRFKAFRYRAITWGLERRFVARIEATPKGLDVRYVVTSLKAGARHLYETLYCARGNAENLIKLHKSQLASDPISDLFRHFGGGQAGRKRYFQRVVEQTLHLIQNQTQLEVDESALLKPLRQSFVIPPQLQASASSAQSRLQRRRSGWR